MPCGRYFLYFSCTFYTWKAVIWAWIIAVVCRQRAKDGKASLVETARCPLGNEMGTTGLQIRGGAPLTGYTRVTCVSLFRCSSVVRMSCIISWNISMFVMWLQKNGTFLSSRQHVTRLTRSRKLPTMNWSLTVELRNSCRLPLLLYAVDAMKWSSSDIDIWVTENCISRAFFRYFGSYDVM